VETVRKRLRVYHSTTEPLLEFYRSQAEVLDLDGLGRIEAVQAELRRLLRGDV
jgi:adenylate kinase